MHKFPFYSIRREIKTKAFRSRTSKTKPRHVVMKSYKIIALPAMLYGAENRVLTPNDKIRFHAIQMHSNIEYLKKRQYQK